MFGTARRHVSPVKEPGCQSSSDQLGEIWQGTSLSVVDPELSTGWVDQWVVLYWVGSS